MVAEGKKQKVRIILDYVINHTSDQHKWFLASKSSKTSPYRNWYVWHDAKARQPAAQQLDLGIRRIGLEVRSHNQPVLLPLLLRGAAGLELE